jgi:hypothetical protein
MVNYTPGKIIKAAPKKKAAVPTKDPAKNVQTGQPQGGLSTQTDQKTKEIMSQTPQTAGDIIKQSRIIAAKTGKDPNTLAGNIAQSTINTQTPAAQSSTVAQNPTIPPNAAGEIPNHQQKGTFLEETKIGQTIGKGLEKIGIDVNMPTEVYLAALTSGISTIGLIGKTNKIASIAKVGIKTPMPTTAAETISVNAATAAKTSSWLSKLASQLKNPAFVAGALIGTIGTYPFAGFIKEEALQTLGFASANAIKNKDVEGAQAAIDAQKEVLNPDLWKKIIDGVPYANVVDQLKDYYKAATIKVAVDEKMLDDLTKQQSGETPEETWNRHKEEQTAAEKERVDYYNQERKKLFLWEQQATDADMIEDAAFWAAEQAKQRAFEKADQEAIQAFWTEYQRKSQEAQDDNRPSKLAFGLIK